MGYGGSLQDAGRAVGRTGDGGIDGIIKEDRLGLEYLYIQAKRWEGTISRPQVQQFSGALDDKGARKGVFITTSRFSAEAKEYAERATAKRIVLVDGAELARLMMEHGVGVTTVATYAVRKVDPDYFEGME
jgi:restriction system protein